MRRIGALGLFVVALMASGNPGTAKATAKPKEPQPWFGMSVRPHRTGSTDPFLYVERTTPRGPADQAGIRSGDLITKVGEASLRFADDLDVLLFLGAQKPGSKITFHVIRNGQRKSIAVTVGTLPESAREGWRLALQRAREARIAAQRGQ